MSLADERQQMVFAQRIQLDVANQHHLVVGGLEDGAVDDLGDVLFVTLRQELHRARRAVRRAQQAFAVGVLAQRLNDGAVMLFHIVIFSSRCGDIIPRGCRRLSRAPGNNRRRSKMNEMSLKPVVGEVRAIPIDLIRPGSQQARRHFDADALRELAESIRESGVIQPIVLRTRVWGYELLAGERRWRAAQLAELHDIPAVIRDDLSDTEAFVVGLIENLQRESLTPIETAAGLKRLGEVFALTHGEIGSRIGKSREYVTNYLRLLNLAPDVARLVNEGHILLGHAKVLAGVPLDQQIHWADQIIRHKLTVRGLEQRLNAARDAKLVFRPGKPADWQILERELADHLACPVAVTADKSGKGELRIRFHTLDELDGVLARIGYVSR